MIDREHTSDTMKNLLAVPVSYHRLLGGKLAVAAALSLIFGVYSVIATVVTGSLAGLDGFSMIVLARQGGQVILAAFYTGLVCMPLILIFGQIRGAYLAGSLLTFFLGYCILFFKGGFLLSAYPFSAALVLSGIQRRHRVSQYSAGAFRHAFGSAFDCRGPVLLSSGQQGRKLRKEEKEKGPRPAAAQVRRTL